MCALCDRAEATSVLVPGIHTIHDPARHRTAHVHTMKLCAPCRARVVAGRSKLGWSWEGGRWGRLGSMSPDGDKYVAVGP
jgi:hypothetical protein